MDKKEKRREPQLAVKSAVSKFEQLESRTSTTPTTSPTPQIPLSQKVKNLVAQYEVTHLIPVTGSNDPRNSIVRKTPSSALSEKPAVGQTVNRPEKLATLSSSRRITATSEPQKLSNTTVKQPARPSTRNPRELPPPMAVRTVSTELGALRNITSSSDSNDSTVVPTQKPNLSMSAPIHSLRESDSSTQQIFSASRNKLEVRRAQTVHSTRSSTSSQDPTNTKHESNNHM